MNARQLVERLDLLLNTGADLFSSSYTDDLDRLVYEFSLDWYNGYQNCELELNLNQCDSVCASIITDVLSNTNPNPLRGIYTNLVDKTRVTLKDSTWLDKTDKDTPLSIAAKVYDLFATIVDCANRHYTIVDYDYTKVQQRHVLEWRYDESNVIYNDVAESYIFNTYLLGVSVSYTLKNRFVTEDPEYPELIKDLVSLYLELAESLLRRGKYNYILVDDILYKLNRLYDKYDDVKVISNKQVVYDEVIF